MEQGQVALLRSGSDIRMNTYYLKFLLPRDAKPTPMRVPNPLLAPPPKKRKKPSSGGGGGGGSSGGSVGGTASWSGKSGAALVESLEQTPVDKLLEVFWEAIHNNQWERRHQMMCGAINFHAVRDAARSPQMQELAAQNNGVSRSEVMEWIQNSPKYSSWVAEVLKKMELKSYQANVTKCLWKAKYKRNASIGRFVRWRLPDEEELGDAPSSSSSSSPPTGGKKPETATPKAEGTAPPDDTGSLFPTQDTPASGAAESPAAGSSTVQGGTEPAAAADTTSSQQEQESRPASQQGQAGQPQSTPTLDGPTKMDTDIGDKPSMEEDRELEDNRQDMPNEDGMDSEGDLDPTPDGVQ